MKFCDKLQKIRKENNITQEGLADKLGVSRQAVSKWESGTAYPDTEKLIQISKIFKISLDELINDDKGILKNENKNKFNFMEIINTSFEFISKSFCMFWAMKFWEKIKLIFEMFILIILIICFAFLSKTVIIELLRRILIFLPNNFLNYLIYILDTLLLIVWIVLGFYIVIKIFKARYLDYYIILEDDSVKERVLEEPIKELKEKKDYKIVIRDPENSSFSIFKKISKLFLWFFKIICFLIVVPIVFLFILAVVFFVISLTFVANGLLFNGISIAILGGIIFLYLVIEFIYNLIFNQKYAFTRIFIMFIISLLLMGIGIGISFIDLSTFKVNDYSYMDKKTNSYVIEMYDNLTIYNFDEIDNNNIIIDNDLKDIKLDISSYVNGTIGLYNYNVRKNDDSLYPVYDTYMIARLNMNSNELEMIQIMIDDLKHRRINTYDYYDIDYTIEKLYISEENLTKIRENYKRISH